MCKPFLVGLLLAGSALSLRAGAAPAIVTRPDTSELERLAARKTPRRLRDRISEMGY